MITNQERYKEIQNFVNEFNSKLREDEQRVIENSSRVNSSPKEREKKEKVKKVSDNLFKDPPAWKPNNYYGKEFDKFMALSHKKQMDLWEIERIHMVKRSFTKEKELPNHKDWTHPSYHGKEFGESQKTKLSDLGNSIIQKFIQSNQKKEEILKQNEEEIFKYSHSKPEPYINPWKNSLHQKEEFIKFPIDDVHSFKAEKKRKYLIDEPFRRPKIDGELFDSYRMK